MTAAHISWALSQVHVVIQWGQCYNPSNEEADREGQIRPWPVSGRPEAAPHYWAPHPLNSPDPGASWKDVSPNFCEARTSGRLRDPDHGLGSPFTNIYELQVKILFL